MPSKQRATARGMHRRSVERIAELEADAKIKQSVCDTIVKEVTEINEKLKAKLTNANRQLDNARDCLWGRKAGYVKGLESALRGMVPFIEDDFPEGTGKNHGTCATDEYQEACNAVIKALNPK